MSLRWKLFGPANYVNLLVNYFYLLTSIIFAIGEIPDDVSLITFLPYFLCPVVGMVNSFYNILVFHKNLPDQLFTNKRRIAYKVSTWLYLVSFILISIAVFSVSIEFFDILSEEYPVSLWIFFVFLPWALGVFILINQFMIRKFIEKNHRYTVGKL